MLSEFDPCAIIMEGDADTLWNKELTCMKVMELRILRGRLSERKNLPWLSKSIIPLIKKCNADVISIPRTLSVHIIILKIQLSLY